MTYNPCPETCPSVFARVVVSRVIHGGTMVLWELRPDFLDPFPHTFQLQFNAVGYAPDHDGWVNVSGLLNNAFFASDGLQRVFGKVDWGFYRVAITTSHGSYFSDPVNGLGTLQFRDWRIAAEILRKERLYNRLSAENGYLLKQRQGGPKCKVCLDFQTGECTDADCPSCFGTTYECGYYAPMPCVWASLSPQTSRLELDSGGGRGTVDDVQVSARMQVVPVMLDGDVWVSKARDMRYFVRGINNVAEIRGVGLVGNVDLRLIPFSHVIYSYQIPGQSDRDGDCT